MWWYIIPGAIGLAALGAIAYIVRRAIPRLVVIDVSTIAHERDAERKQAIILGRADRLRAELMNKARLWARPKGKQAAEAFRRLYRHAVDLEKKHRRLGPATSGTAGTELSRALVLEGTGLVREGKPREAEQKFIEAISANPKHAKAYEELGRLYVKEKQWQEAAEAFRFLLKMDPNDTSAHANMGELAMAEGLPAEAKRHFTKAVSLKPGNPQLQSLLLEAAVAAKDKETALKAFARIKELAPRFPRLMDLENMIKAM